jgi:dTDP-glucose 4,6-dehydratase
MIDLNGKRVLITGTSGFIAQNFLATLEGMYPNIGLVMCMDYAPAFNLRQHFSKEFYDNKIVDLSHTRIERYAFSPDVDRYDVIFNFAAESHVDRSISDPLTFATNLTSTMALLNHVVCEKEKGHNIQMIQISTDEVYGHHLTTSAKPHTEDSQLQPRNPYAASKAAADLMCEAYVSTYDIDVLVTRCTNNFGIYQRTEKFIPTIISKLVAGEKIPVYGEGDNIREWIHVDDHCKSILEIAGERTRGVHNISGGTPKNNLELVQDILTAYNKLVPESEKTMVNSVEFVDDRKGHDKIYAITSKYYLRGFETVPYEDAIDEIVKHYVAYYKGQ